MYSPSYKFIKCKAAGYQEEILSAVSKVQPFTKMNCQWVMFNSSYNLIYYYACDDFRERIHLKCI